ncbi:16121_t:CDS:2 [Rhizophagus irregularis]|nr:16121_t:CDS:2 [Rhizophagus irregularis]
MYNMYPSSYINTLWIIDYYIVNSQMIHSYHPFNLVPKEHSNIIYSYIKSRFITIDFLSSLHAEMAKLWDDSSPKNGKSSTISRHDRNPITTSNPLVKVNANSDEPEFSSMFNLSSIPFYTPLDGEWCLNLDAKILVLDQWRI